jgi:predicted RNase H-like HicB family nuclease
MMKEIDLGMQCGRRLSSLDGFVRYPVYVFVGDKHHTHGVVMPDFPGCFSGADDWQDLPHKIQEAIELWCESENRTLPEPTPLEKLAHDPEYVGGVWMVIDVDVTKLEIRRSAK